MTRTNHLIVRAALLLLLIAPAPLPAETVEVLPHEPGPRFRIPEHFRGSLLGPITAPPPLPHAETLSFLNYSPTLHLDEIYGPRRVELSRYQCALKGAGLAANAGWILGCLANQTDLWERKTSWYLVGAAAATGALLGGTLGADNASWNIGIDWDPDPQH